MTRLVWFRNDLRVLDNPALHHSCREYSGDVYACYLLCESWLRSHPVGPARVYFIKQSLRVLNDSLAAIGIPLIVLRVASAADIAPALANLTTKLKAEAIAFNAEYPLDEITRDRAVATQLRTMHIDVKRFHDRVLIPPGMIQTVKGENYRVFTPFKKQWIARVDMTAFEVYPMPAKRQLNEKCIPADETLDIDALFADLAQRNLSQHWVAGEEAGLERLESFCNNELLHYHEQRDFPAIDGTSQLSPYLALGALSPKQCLVAARARLDGAWQESPGAATWINELAWREFYQHVIAAFPGISRGQPMQLYTRQFPWSKDRDAFERWCLGKTGIPIIDAAMRQLRETGWMHNRLRMVVAMFLTKNLRIHWQWGEHYFMEQLIDGDFAANNGGWQWCASTGTDAAPYFRIMNPVAQSRRFDPDGKFIRRYVPELAGLDKKSIHYPPPMKNYPEAMVDLKSSRAETIELFKSLQAGVTPS